MSEQSTNLLYYDILEDIFESHRFYGSIFFSSKLSSPWGILLEDIKSLQFHISIMGDFFIGPAFIKQPVEIKENGVVILPTSGPHWISDRPGRKLMRTTDMNMAYQKDQELFQKKTCSHSLMCGLINFEEQSTHPLFNALPDFIHIPPIELSSTIWQLIKIIDRELHGSDSLSNVVINRLSEVLFIKLLQEYIKTPGNSVGFFSALHDRRLLFVIQLMHKKMHQDWTIEKLAHQSGMSRATLVRRFRKSVGIPPIQYLTQWRLLKTHNMLKYSNQSLEDISRTVGFASSQTLSKAFKRFYGYTISVRRVTHKSTAINFPTTI